MKIKMKHLIIAAVVKKVIFAVMALFFFTSCVDRDDYGLESIDSVSVTETTMDYVALEIDLMVKNESSSSVIVKESELKLYDVKGREVCDATIISPVVVKKGTNVVTVPVKVTFKGGLLGAARLIGVMNSDLDNMYVSGYIKVRKGLITVNEKVEKIKISDLK